jgi:microcystin-dependent protein
MIYNNLNELTHDLLDVKHRVLPAIQHTLQYTQAMIGDYKYSARTEDIFGWIICDGRTLDRTLFASLFEVIGTSFGSTNSTNFKLPDFRGRVPGMIGTGATLTARTLGTALGEEVHTLSVNEMPSHNHSGTTGAAGFGTNTQGIAALGGGSVDAADNDSNHTHSIASQGGDQAHNNMQPTLFGGNVMIFAGVVQS